METIGLLHEMVGNTYCQDEEFKFEEQFLDCLINLYRRRPSLINEVIFAEKLEKSTGNIDDFLEFFSKYLSKKSDQQEYNIINKLIRGLVNRIPKMVENFSTKRASLLNSYHDLTGKYLLT